MSGCRGCPKRPICTKLCPYIEGLLYTTNNIVCIHDKSACFHDVGVGCGVGDPDKLYSGDMDIMVPCGDQRCSKFLGCELGHKHWVVRCNDERSGGCKDFALVKDTYVHKFGIECGFKKEIAYDSNVIDIIKNRLKTYFGVADDSEIDPMPDGELEDIINISGLDCSTCEIKPTCTAFKLCKDMSNALSSVIEDGIEEEIEGNMRVKLLLGSKYISPEIRLKLIKLLKCEKFLPKRQRDCLWLFFVDQMHQKDIAQLLSSYKCANKNCTYFSPTKVSECSRCGSKKFEKANITSQAVNRYIKWGLSNIRKKFLLDLDLFHAVEYDKKCTVCGKPFRTNFKHQSYCTTQCRVKLYTDKRREMRRSRKPRTKSRTGVVKNILCANPECDVRFTPLPYQKYHTKSCRLKAARQTYKIKIPDLSDHSHLIKRR